MAAAVQEAVGADVVLAAGGVAVGLAAGVQRFFSELLPRHPHILCRCWSSHTSLSEAGFWVGTSGRFSSS